MKAKEQVEKVSRSYIRYARKMADIKDRLERNTEINIAREKAQEEGRVEGRVEGREEERIEIARKMKKAGEPLSKIIEFTGLSIEIIEKL